MTVLDTHILVWFVSSPEKLPEQVRRHLDREIKRDGLLASSISVWEIYMLVKKGRLRLSMNLDTWIDKVEQLTFLQFIPVDNKIAASSVILPEPLHNDPADRIILATAREYAATLVTSDTQLLNYPHVRTLW